MFTDRRWIDNNNLEQGMRQGNKIMQIFFSAPDNYSFNSEQIFTEYLLYDKHCAVEWSYRIQLSVTYSLIEETNT